MFACQVDGCPRAFTFGSTYPSFLSHVTRKHPNWKDALDSRAPLTRCRLPVVDVEDMQKIPDVPGCNNAGDDGMDIDEVEELTHGHPSHINECEISDAQRAAEFC